ncbi:bifunctional 3'-5' exonuclease/DNA polymerase [Paractinoplanes ovalisporus]|uniref:bifunctional 3'-5' exonuclease/DNA polymerase n=1 Tax=Paractinoplanes ovalisporus TaxID=2810368 RepID=UPI0027DE2E94|nr:bifunctional 3'-5' exonuclease/DNA polymerase [Actinoplanes ovalisporus]
MLTAVAGDPGGRGGRLQDLHADGTPAGAVRPVTDLAGAIGEREAADHPRWVWPATSEVYPALLKAGVRVARGHDLELTEALLMGHAGWWGSPKALPAARARLHGLPVPADPPPRPAEPPGYAQGALFDTGAAPAAGHGFDVLEAVREVYADQLRRIGATEFPGRFRLLVAAESAGALVGAEMGFAGLPWRADLHDELLRELLGPPQPVGPPRRLAELSAEINAAFGTWGLHPDSPAEVVRAFARSGVDVPNTRAWVLRKVDHPAVRPLLEYKELYRIWTAHGWSWCDAWVSHGRFRPEYVPGGVVSGRWATRGGGALQVPKAVRRAVVADPGWTFVVADAGQLEPRVLAAISSDERFAAAAAAGDLYAALAADSFDGDRAKAKLALLGAMYGQTGGAAIPALAVLRKSYPTAFEFVEQAARVGEAGGLVRSWLGRTCPPSSGAWRDAGLDPPEEAGSAEAPQGGASGRARGRFTRNFVVQATAAEWALVLLATLRTALDGTKAEMVLFVHDEVVVHCPVEQADEVVAAVHESAAQAGRLLFGDTTVRFPLDVSVVAAYADAK